MFGLKWKMFSKILIVIVLSLILIGLGLRNIHAGGGQTLSKKFTVNLKLNSDYVKTSQPADVLPFIPVWDEVYIDRCEVRWVKNSDAGGNIGTLFNVDDDSSGNIGSKKFYPSTWKLSNMPAMFGGRQVSFTGDFTINEFPAEGGYPVELRISGKFHQVTYTEYRSGGEVGFKATIIRQSYNSFFRTITTGNAFSFSW